MLCTACCHHPGEVKHVVRLDSRGLVGVFLKFVFLVVWPGPNWKLWQRPVVQSFVASLGYLPDARTWDLLLQTLVRKPEGKLWSGVEHA